MRNQERPQRKRFALVGHSAVIDPLVHALRDDLADVELADRVFAPHYARATAYRVMTVASVYQKPDPDAEILEKLSVGATVDLFDINGGWAWIRSTKGVGYTRAEGLLPL